MSWIQITIDCLAEQAELFEEQLLAIGALTVTLQDAADQPLYEPRPGTTPLWRDTQVVSLFEADTEMALVEQFLKNTIPLDPFPHYKIEIVEDKDWEREWMDNFHPMRFGERLWVCPSWRDVPDPDAVNLMLDPGLAFGTGTHPTTALCLEWLDAQHLENLQLLDYGCGSGILGIAGLLLGAREMIGVDIDPQALEATEENARRNGLDLKRLTLCYPEQCPELQADVLVANILAGPLVELAPTLAGLVKPGAPFALSGILAEQAEQIQAAYAHYFNLDPIAQKEDWIRVSGRRLAN